MPAIKAAAPLRIHTRLIIRTIIPLMLLWTANCFSADKERIATGTLRVDYYHTGSASKETFSLDEVVIEPLPWPGSLHQRFDKLDRGKYRFKVSDKESGKLLFSRSFSSIFGEWETTAEASSMERTFHESVRFPKPRSPVTITVEKRDQQQKFAQVWTIDIDPNHYLNHRETRRYSDQVFPLEKNGPSSEKVDLLILGDGYTEDEIDDFRIKARQMSEALFATSPFKEHRKDFNVWALAPIADKSGVSRPSTGDYRDSPLGTSYDIFGSERYVLTYDNKSFRRIASSAPYDFVEILVNNETYGGGGIYGLYSTASANSEWADYLFIHEFGHHFAGLADEYFTGSVAYTPNLNILEPYRPNVTALLPDQPLKWRHLVKSDALIPSAWPVDAYVAHATEYQRKRKQLRDENRPEREMNELFRENQEIIEEMFANHKNHKEIGAYRGANYSSLDYYRSEMNCLMFTRTDDFCQVCQNAIVDVINMYSTR